MKIKILLISFCVLFLSGCTATYELDITGNQFKETIYIDDLNLSSSDIQIFTTNPMPVDYRETCYLDYDRLVKPNEIEKENGVNYYDVKENNNGLIATANINIKEYKYSRPLNYAFVNMNVNNYDDYISIYGFDGPAIFNMYNNLDSFKVVIRTDKEVTEHNADKKNDNEYIWEFTPEDETKELYIEMDSTKVTTEKENEKEKKLQIFVAASVFGVIIAIAIIISVIMAIKHHHNNKI